MFAVLNCADYDAFMNDLKNVTKGDFTFDVEGQSVATTENEGAPAKGKGRGGKGGRGGRGRGSK